MSSSHPHHHPNQSPPAKRTRLTEGSIPPASGNTDWFETAWSHFHAFMEEDDNDKGDNDCVPKNWQALEDLIVLAEPHVNARVSNLLPISQLTTRERLVPVLVSVASHLLAQHYMTIMPQQQQQQEDNKNDLANIITRHLQRAVTVFSKNAAAFCLGAEYMVTNNNNNCTTIAAWCEHAVRLAQRVKLEANLVLEQDESLRLAGRVLLELLVMNQVVGVELNEQDEDELDDEYDDDDEDEEEEDLWSPSTVESKARYLAALMRSAMGDHEMAEQHLQQFLPNGLTHRLHPNVWMGGGNCLPAPTSEQEQQQQQQQPKVATSVRWEPTVVSGRPGVLPVELHQRLCHDFGSPDAAYWKECRRHQQGKREGHFSFFVPIQQHTAVQPMNVVEHAVCQYVLPLVQQKLEASQHDNAEAPICGFDWWVDHHQPTGRRLDFHKVLLPTEQTVAIPVVSSVLFLQGENMAAVVLDQTPDDSSELATTAWRCPAVENTLFMFAGNLLHGIVPQCEEKDTSKTQNKKKNSSSKPVVQDLLQKFDTALACLTLHVGFWTRPIDLTGRQAYVPCGPMPLATDDKNMWVKLLSEGYPTGKALNQDPPSPPTVESAVICGTVPRISPAWQKIAAPSKQRKPPLEVPRKFDQRFFLKYEPGCFQDYLFDDDDSDQSSQGDDK